MILQHQIHGMPGQQNLAIINSAYNHHIHHKNCFDKEAAKQAEIRSLRMLFQKVPMIPEIHLKVIIHVILLNKRQE